MAASACANNRSSSSAKSDKQRSDPSTDRFDPAEHELRRCLPPRYSTKRNDIYITQHTNFAAQLNRCQKLLDKGYDEVYLHGLGRACNRAINLALQVKRQGLGSLDLDVNTSTVKATDELVPLLDESGPGSIQRNVSAVHIRIFRPDTPVRDY